MELAPVAMEIARLKPLAWTDVASILATVSAGRTRPVASSTTGRLAPARLDSTPIRLPIADVSVRLRAAVPMEIVRLEVPVWAASVKLSAGTLSIAPKANAAFPACANCLVSATNSAPTARLASLDSAGPAVAPTPTVPSMRPDSTTDAKVPANARESAVSTPFVASSTVPPSALAQTVIYS